MRSRTLLINHARGIAKSSGAPLPSCSAGSFPAKVATFIPEALRPALLPMLDTIASLTQQIRAYDRQIHQSLCQAQYPESQLLRQVAGNTGDTDLRRLLVGCAQYMLGPFGPDCLYPARVRSSPIGAPLG